MSTRPRRAMLFIPGHDQSQIDKGAALTVDSIILDLEDRVALPQKEQARHTVRRALKDVAFGSSERLVRINAVLDSLDLWKADIELTVEGRPDGYVIPKVENAGQMLEVDAELTRLERNYGWIDGSIKLLAFIETAKGVVNLKEIVESSRRLSALIFGADDLASEMGAIRTPDGWEVFYARSAVVTHARAYGLQAIDTPYTELTTETSNLVADAEQAHYMGFCGKLAIRPEQVEVIQRVFTPTDEQVREAQALVSAYHEAGQGVFEYEGRLIDPPRVRVAEGIIARASAR